MLVESTHASKPVKTRQEFCFLSADGVSVEVLGKKYITLGIPLK